MHPLSVHSNAEPGRCHSASKGAGFPQCGLTALWKFSRVLSEAKALKRDGNV